MPLRAAKRRRERSAMIALPSFDRYSILFHYEIDANERGERAKSMACFALFVGERAVDPPVRLSSAVLRTKTAFARRF